MAANGSTRRRTGWLAAAAVLAALDGGCATPLACVQEGGRWLRVTSPHLTVDTDVSEGEAKRVVRDLERSLHALSHFLTRKPAALRMRLVLLDDEEQYFTFGPAHSRAALLGERWFDLEPEPLLLMARFPDRDVDFVREADSNDFVHEATHRIMEAYTPQIPRWTNEGLAEYCETMRPDADGLLLGRQGHTAPLVERLPTVSELLDSTVEDFIAPERPGHVSAYYRGSWLFIHYLMDSMPQVVGGFLAGMEAGRPVDAAWQAALGPLTRSDLEAAFQQYVVRGRAAIQRMPLLPMPEVAVAAAPLDERAVHRLWLRLSGSHRAEGIDRQIALAEAHLGARDPDVLRYRVALRGDKDPEGTEALLKALSEAVPDSLFVAEWRARRTLGALGGKEITPSHRKVLAELAAQLARRASQPETLALTGDLLGILDRVDEGLPFARRAVEKAPHCWRCLDVLARLLADTGDYRQAERVQELAVARIPDYVDGPVAARLTLRLSGYRKEARRGAIP